MNSEDCYSIVWIDLGSIFFGMVKKIRRLIVLLSKFFKIRGKNKQLIEMN